MWLGDKPLGLVVGPAASATLHFVHADHLERVQKITDATQAVVWDGQFTPYGRTHAITGTVQNPLRFPGQWADPAANYFYNYMRDYDPTLARYLAVDPIGTTGGRNRFGYAGANPQNMIDPSGEASYLGTAALFGLVSVGLDYALHQISGSCQPYTLTQGLTAFSIGAVLGVGGRFLPRLLGFGKAKPPGGLGPGAGPGSGLAGPGAGAAGSAQGASLFSRFLASESGALSLSPSSRALAAALEAAGAVRPAASAAHHIVAGSAPAAAAARAVLQNVGVGINEAANGVFLSASRHAALHTSTYYTAVNRALANVSTRAEAVRVLQSLARGLQAGKFP